MNKSINIKEEILNSFRENYEQKDGEWGYHGWVEETGFGEVYEFLSNSLDRMESEVREETRKQTTEESIVKLRYLLVSNGRLGLTQGQIEIVTHIFGKYLAEEAE